MLLGLCSKFQQTVHYSIGSWHWYANNDLQLVVDLVNSHRVTYSKYEYVKCSDAWESRNTRNTDDFLLFRYETFIDFLNLVFRYGERETQFLLCWPFHLTQQTRGASRRSQTGLASSRSKSQLDSSSIRSQLTAFFQKSRKFPAPRFRAWRHSHPSPYPIWSFYYDICDCHIFRARAGTPALNVCTYTCTKPNSSKPN